ncbi:MULTISPECIES: hypothetical protein [Streptomyces]|uniref:Uncharacterized protein n=2 Tax=Streptomyces rimosus subsp. rimosus TaxID=132474 RepID=L8EZ92_STRR1|nr:MULTISPECIES: hypothetical protein [Streptomyces]KOG70527.1 hypothetical protein ADK78_28475 [Kitasatospora aureofaciens]MYT47304.1 hypothetical protein [Streptomyces sp. SID5471]KEF04636.1 hypothetical protein DF17_22360 [Streptomyces rimosus]KEF19944.1 hypothetical protein DF18_14010 [Streptomyces rimosus]KOT31354.1 hypothetical protein ADK84_29990 [Streptomyces sp. NRRL WC-3701]
MDTISQSTVGERRADQVPLTPGQQMRAYSDDGAVVIDVAVQAVGHCHTCGTSVPFGIGEVHGSAQKYVDGPYKDGLLAAWGWTDRHLAACAKARRHLRRPATGPMTNCEAYRNLPPQEAAPVAHMAAALFHLQQAVATVSQADRASYLAGNASNRTDTTDEQ